MILVFGKSGQLAKSMSLSVPAHLDGKVVFLSSREADFAHPEKMKGYLDHYGPTQVIVCSAYTAVDKAEEERELAQKINFEAPREIARWCGLNDAKLIYFSSDYVFPGSGNTPWKETDDTAPLNWYGETKEMGETAIQISGCKYFIFRTSWVYSEFGSNFVRTMLKLGHQKDHLRIVDDQVGGPTYAPALAEIVWKIVDQIDREEPLKYGLYHIAGTGEVSWAGFAEKIFEIARSLKYDLRVNSIERIPTEDYPTPAKRPLNSRLDQSKLKDQLGIVMPEWTESLQLCLRKLYASYSV